METDNLRDFCEDSDSDIKKKDSRGRWGKVSRKKKFLILFLAYACFKVVMIYGPYTGQVVELETGKPIAGAAVSIAFFTTAGSVAGEVSYFADAVETLTDSNGEFELPLHLSFSLRAIKPLQFWDVHGHVRIFKPGYGCYPNHLKVEPRFRPNGTLPRNEYLTISLPKLKTKEERLINYDCSQSPSVPRTKYEKLFSLTQNELESLGF